MQQIIIFKDEPFKVDPLFAVDACNSFLTVMGDTINVEECNTNALVTRNEFTGQQAIMDIITLRYSRVSKDQSTTTEQPPVTEQPTGVTGVSNLGTTDAFALLVMNMTNFNFILQGKIDAVGDKVDGLNTNVFPLTKKIDTIMSTQLELASQLNDLNTQLGKANDEIQADIKTLDDKIAALTADPTKADVLPELQAAFDSLKAKVQVLDDIIPDTPPVVDGTGGSTGGDTGSTGGDTGSTGTDGSTVTTGDGSPLTTDDGSNIVTNNGTPDAVTGV